MNKPDHCKNKGQFPTVSNLATTSLDYKPFQQSRPPPTKHKEATFVPINFHFIDDVPSVKPAYSKNTYEGIHCHKDDTDFDEQHHHHLGLSQCEHLQVFDAELCHFLEKLIHEQLFNSV